MPPQLKLIDEKGQLLDSAPVEQLKLTNEKGQSLNQPASQPPVSGQEMTNRREASKQAFERNLPGFLPTLGGRVAENIQGMVQQPLGALTDALTGKGTARAQQLIEGIPGGLKAATWDMIPRLYDAAMQKQSPGEAANTVADFITNTAPMLAGLPGMGRAGLSAATNPEFLLRQAANLRAFKVPSWAPAVAAGGAAGTAITGSLLGHPFAATAGALGELVSPLVVRYGADAAAGILERAAQRMPQKASTLSMPPSPEAFPVQRPTSAPTQAIGGGRIAPIAASVERPPLPSEPTTYGQFPGQTQQTTATRYQPPPDTGLPQMAPSNPTVALARNITTDAGKPITKAASAAANRLAQVAPELTKMGPGPAFDQALLQGYRQAGLAIQSAEAEIPAGTAVPTAQIKSAWKNLRADYDARGLTSHANSVDSMLEKLGTADSIPWDKFQQLKRTWFPYGTKRAGVLRQAYEPFITAVRGISPALDEANTTSSAFRQALDAGLIDLQTGIRMR